MDSLKGERGEQGDRGPQGPAISTTENAADVCLNNQGKIIAFAACSQSQKNGGASDKTVVFFVK